MGTVETWRNFEVREIGLFGALLETSELIPSGTRLKGRLIVRGRRQDMEAEVRHARPLTASSQAARCLVGLAFADPLTGGVGELFREQPMGRELNARVASDRRRSWRMACFGDVEFGIHSWGDIELHDLSMGGAMFSSITPLTAGARGQLRTRLADQSFAADIEVQRIAPNVESARHTYRIVASFLGLDELNQRSLASFLTAAKM